MSFARKQELLGRLRLYAPAQIYTIAPKQYIFRGFEYYRNGDLVKFGWSEDYSLLTAYVRGNRLYNVTFNGAGNALNFHCTCPAWTHLTNCKHVICSLVTIKNLLDPEIFRTKNTGDDRWENLYKELYGEPRNQLAQPDSKLITLPGGTMSGRLGTAPLNTGAATKSDPPVYSLVIKKDKLITDINVRMDGKRIKKSYYTCPYELRQFVSPESYYAVNGIQRDLARFLEKYGNRYPIILKKGKQEQQIRFENAGAYQTKTELDAYGDFVTVSKVCTHEGKDIRGDDISGDYVFNIDKGTFGLIVDRSGWQLWNETAYLLESTGAYEDVPDHEATSFRMPPEMLESSRLIFPASEGDLPRALVLKTEGSEAQIARPSPSYRITINRVAGENFFTLRPECIFSGAHIPPAFKLFKFLLFSGHGTNPSLRTNRRRAALCAAFFAMLSEKSPTAAEVVIRKALSEEEFYKLKIRREARNFLKRHLAVFFLKERELVLHDKQWITVDVLKDRELDLYRIPYEMFGWEIFRDMQYHDIMIVPAEELNMKLPLLHERLMEKNIGLFFENKPVRTTTCDFAFDATRQKDLDWFEIKPEISCDGKLIDGPTWQRILAGKGAIEKDDCVEILDAASQKVFSIISDIYKTDGEGKGRQKEIMRVPRLRILDWITLRNSGIRITLSPEDEEIISRLTTFEKISPRPLPSKLKATLRQYQKDGYAWLTFLYENRFGGCLADDMGLGKTIQAISLLGGLKEARDNALVEDEIYQPHLIVLPPSLLFNWENEINRFYPDIRTTFYTGKERSTEFKDCDAVLTTYGLVRRDIERLKEIQFDVIIFDEAQAIKNIYADTTGAVRQLNGRFKLAMTGTPLENHIGEYFSIVDLAVPGLLGEYEDFMPLVKQEISPALDRIIRRTRPFVLRRTKEKILAELPPKTETDIYLDLTEKQKALYKKTVEQVRSAIDDAYGTKTGAQAQIIALTAILKLRQLCVSPQLLSPEIRDSSPKIDFLIKSLMELLEEDHSALVFSQFTSFLDLLEHDLKKHGLEFMRLDGSTPVNKRKKLIESFQSGEGASIFLLSLKAGGQGLNLTKASYVFHLDPWWNPAVENQASDRAHRIGQKKNVTITRILMRHTIEEKMMALKKKKLELYKAVMEDSSYGKKGLSISRADFDFLLS